MRVVAIFVFALLLRGGWLLYDNGLQILWEPKLVADEREYDALARQIVAGNGFIQSKSHQGKRALPGTGNPTAFRTPGLPVLLAGIYWMTGRDHGVARLTLLFLTAFTAPLLYLLCLVLFRSESLAVLVACGYASSWTSIHMSGWLMGEEVSTLLVVLALLLTILAERRTSVSLICLAGLLLSMAVLTRGFLLFLPLAPAAWLVARKAKGLALLLLVTAVILPAAWVVRNVVSVGLFTLSTETPEVLWLGNNSWARGSWPGDWLPQHKYLLQRYPNFDRLDEVGHYRVFLSEAASEIIGNPKRVLWLLPRKAVIFFSPVSWMGTDWVLAFFLPFSFVGFLLLWFQPGSRQLLWILGGGIVGVLIVSLMAYADVRHRHPIDPLILILGGVTMREIVSRFVTKGGRQLS